MPTLAEMGFTLQICDGIIVTVFILGSVLALLVNHNYGKKG